MFEVLAAVVCLSQQEQNPPNEPGDQKEQKVQLPEPMPIPVAAVCRLGDARIVIDGSLGDWPALPPIALDDVRQVSGTALGAFRARDDIAARAFLAWDDDDLYIAVAAEDDLHVQLPADRSMVNEIPPADSVLFTFDPDRDTRAIGNDAHRAEDTSFWLADVEGQGNRLVLWDRFRGGARFAQGGACMVSRDKDRRLTTYEARIPWAEILPHGRKPAAGMAIGAQIVISDYDDPTDPMPQTRIGWTFGMGPLIDPGLFGTLMLVDTPAKDAAKMRAIPEPPPVPETKEPPVPEAAYWIGLANRITKSEPAFVAHDTADPAFAGGPEWHDLLIELDKRIAEFPRVDFLEYQNEIHRRMNRECAGIAARGLPYFWDSQLEATLRRANAEPPETGFALWRLPQGGWLLRSRQATIAIDPAGYRVEKLIDSKLDMILLTAPLDPTRRNDQLLARAALSEPKPPIFNHIAIALPGVEAKNFPLVVPGQEYDRAGLKVKVCGYVDKDGMVGRSVGYRVRWPDGTTLVVSGVELVEEAVDREGGIDCLLLSAMHPYARSLGQRLAPRLTVVDDVFRCADIPGAEGRAKIEDAFDLQNGLRPSRSVVLMPGQSIEVGPRPKGGGERRGG